MLGLRPYTLLGGEQEEGMTEGRKEGMKGRKEAGNKQRREERNMVNEYTYSYHSYSHYSSY